MRLAEDLTLCVDPGEDTGWSVWRGPLLVGAHTTKMWDFADEAWAALSGRDGAWLSDPSAAWVREGMEKHAGLEFGRVVCEDWRLYPKDLKALAWDQCRTARLIGALTFMARTLELDFHLQPAAIKQTSLDAGAEEFFYKPLHENRHQNDSIMHGWYFAQFGEDGDPRVINRVSKAEQK